MFGNKSESVDLFPFFILKQRILGCLIMNNALTVKI